MRHRIFAGFCRYYTYLYSCPVWRVTVPEYRSLLKVEPQFHREVTLAVVCQRFRASFQAGCASMIILTLALAAALPFAVSPIAWPKVRVSLTSLGGIVAGQM